MPLRNGLKEVVLPGNPIRFAGHAANRRLGSREIVVIDQNPITGLTRISFTDNFGTRLIRTVPSHWIETLTGRANQPGGQLGIGGGFGGVPGPSPT